MFDTLKAVSKLVLKALGSDAHRFESALNLPNAITIGRILVAPLIAALPFMTRPFARLGGVRRLHHRGGLGLLRWNARADAKPRH